MSKRKLKVSKPANAPKEQISLKELSELITKLEDYCDQHSEQIRELEDKLAALDENQLDIQDKINDLENYTNI